MSRPGTERIAPVIAAAAAAIGLTLWLAGCSDLYWDRRETVSLGGGDAIAANTATQMVDPWPPGSGDKNIAFNGQKMQSAVERYRTNTVIPPIGATTSDVTPIASASGTPPAAAPAPAQSASSGMTAPGTMASQ